VAISSDEVRRIAALANLELDRSTESLRERLRSILDHVALLDELDVADVSPTSFGCGDAQRVREDEVRPSLSAERAVENAPDPAAGHFRVPRVVER